MMFKEPETAWVEAARNAAARTYEAVGSMDSLELDLTIISQADANGTNSRDRHFLDSLIAGSHLSGEFLANAQ